MSYEPIDPSKCETCYMKQPGYQFTPYCKSERKYWKCEHCGIELGRCEIINERGDILCRGCYESSIEYVVNKDNKSWQKWREEVLDYQKDGYRQKGIVVQKPKGRNIELEDDE